MGFENILTKLFREEDLTNLKRKQIIDRYINNINDRDVDGDTLLHIACEKVEKYGIEMVEFLLSKNIDVNIRDGEGYTALQCIVSYYVPLSKNIIDYIKVIKLLLQYGADVNKTSVFNGTVLHHAIDNYHQDGYIEIIMLLLKHGADINIEDYNGRTGLNIVDNKIYAFENIYGITSDYHHKLYISLIHLIKLMRHPHEIYKRKVITTTRIREDYGKLTKEDIVF